MKTYNDIPLTADPSSKFVPWIVSLMTYLATLALIVAFVVSALLDEWDTGFTAKMTVEIPPPNYFAGDSKEVMSQMTSRTLRVLMRAPGLGSIRELKPEETLSYLKPLGGEKGVELPLGSLKDILQDIPLSTFIDVEVLDRGKLNTKRLEKALHAINPSIVLTDHLGWQRGIIDLTRSSQIIGFLIVSLIILAAISTIAFTSQTSLIIHRHVIEILYLVGASDEYIARQFQYHALRIGLRGGTVGFFLSAATFITLAVFSRDLDTTLIGNVVSMFAVWAVALLVPLFITAFMMISARFSVKWALKTGAYL